MVFCSSLAATVPGPAQSTGAVGPLTKNPSVDSAYAEGGKVITLIVCGNSVLSIISLVTHYTMKFSLLSFSDLRSRSASHGDQPSVGR